MKDGIGGQTPPSAAMNETSISAPLEVVVEAGEWEVVLSLLRDSIPQLLVIGMESDDEYWSTECYRGSG